MKNLKHITYLFTIFFLFISCEKNTKKSDVKETNKSEVKRPTQKILNWKKTISSY